MLVRTSLFLAIVSFVLAGEARANEMNWPACDLSVVTAKGQAISSVALKVSDGLTYEKYRPGTGSDLVVHKGQLGSLAASVDHFIETTTLTMVLKRGPETLLVTLARVPTANNSQSFAKVKLPEGNWAKIECETQGFDF